MITSLLFHCCFTVVSLLFHCCFTVVSLLFHCCFTVVSCNHLRSCLFFNHIRFIAFVSSLSFHRLRSCLLHPLFLHVPPVAQAAFATAIRPPFGTRTRNIWSKRGNSPWSRGGKAPCWKWSERWSRARVTKDPKVRVVVGWCGVWCVVVWCVVCGGVVCGVWCLVCDCGVWWWLICCLVVNLLFGCLCYLRRILNLTRLCFCCCLCHLFLCPFQLSSRHRRGRCELETSHVV
jgi:hypothetical protein